MNREQAKAMREAFNAFCDGKQIQSEHGELWCDINEPQFDPYAKYRVKPSPKYRPWKYEEVPVGKVVKAKIGNYAHIIAGKSCSGVLAEISIESRWMDAEHVLTHYEMEDGTPCGTKEEQ